MINWHKQNLTERMYLNIELGKKITMPRYYKEKIYTEIERKKIGHAAKQRALEAMDKILSEYESEYDYNWDTVMKTKELFAKMYKQSEQARDKV